MADNEFNRKFMKSTKSTSESAKTILIISIALNLFMSGAFQYMA